MVPAHHFEIGEANVKSGAGTPNRTPNILSLHLIADNLVRVARYESPNVAEQRKICNSNPSEIFTDRRPVRLVDNRNMCGYILRGHP